MKNFKVTIHPALYEKALADAGLDIVELNSPVSHPCFHPDVDHLAHLIEAIGQSFVIDRLHELLQLVQFLDQVLDAIGVEMVLSQLTLHRLHIAVVRGSLVVEQTQVLSHEIHNLVEGVTQ